MVNIYTGELPKAVVDEHFPFATYSIIVRVNGNRIPNDLEKRAVRIERERLENLALSVARMSFKDSRIPYSAEYKIQERNPIAEHITWLADFHIANSRLNVTYPTGSSEVKHLGGFVEVEAIGYADRKIRPKQ